VVSSAVDDEHGHRRRHVVDVNDHAPTFGVDLVELTVSEAAPLDARLSLLPAVDQDVGTNSVQVYSLSDTDITMYTMKQGRSDGGYIGIYTSQNQFLKIILCTHCTSD